MPLSKMILILSSIALLTSAQEMIKKNCFLADIYISTKGFESENSDLLHWYVSYERNIVHSLYLSAGFSFYRTPKGTIKFQQDGKQWDIPVLLGLIVGKGKHRFNSSIGVDLSIYKLNDTPRTMVGLSKRGFELHPTITTSWRIYPKQIPIFTDIGNKIVVDYHGGLPLSIALGGGVGYTF